MLNNHRINIHIAIIINIIGTNCAKHEIQNMISYKEYIATGEKHIFRFYCDPIDPSTKNENTDQQKN